MEYPHVRSSGVSVCVWFVLRWTQNPVARSYQAITVSPEGKGELLSLEGIESLIRKPFNMDKSTLQTLIFLMKMVGNLVKLDPFELPNGMEIRLRLLFVWKLLKG